MQIGLKIRNPLGLHARIASRIVNIVEDHDTDIVLKMGNKVASAHQIIQIILLGGRYGDAIIVETQKEEFESLVIEIVKVLEGVE